MIRIAYAFSIISGTIIGAGFFALPYLTLKTNPFVMAIYFVVLGLVSILVHYFFADAALKTPNYIRLPGFAKYHLGKKAYKIALISGVLSVLGSNLAYLILGGKFLQAIFAPFFGMGETFYTIIYFAIGAILIFFGIKAIDKVQLGGLILLFVSLVALFVKGAHQIDFSQLIFESNPSFFLLPFGVVLFSLWGVSLVPEAEEVLKEKSNYLKKIIPFAVILPMIVYLLFIVLILGLSGNETPPDALSFLNKSLGANLTYLILSMAIITTFTSFIALGLTLKKMLWHDLKINEKLSWAIASFVPISLYFLGIKDFIQVIGFVGGIMLAIDGIIVSLIYKKLSSLSVRFIVYPVILILVLGVFSEIISFFLCK